MKLVSRAFVVVLAVSLSVPALAAKGLIDQAATYAEENPGKTLAGVFTTFAAIVATVGHARAKPAIRKAAIPTPVRVTPDPATYHPVDIGDMKVGGSAGHQRAAQAFNAERAIIRTVIGDMRAMHTQIQELQHYTVGVGAETRAATNAINTLPSQQTASWGKWLLGAIGLGATYKTADVAHEWYCEENPDSSTCATSQDIAHGIRDTVKGLAKKAK